ncbi:MAG: methyltransferase domain-containing protein [Akkermansiaceae bacterium]
MDWDKRYIDADTPWDKGAPAPILSKLVEQGAFPHEVEILVPGCGFGHDVRALAAAGYSVTGMDISQHALDVAVNMAADAKGEMSFVLADLFDPELATKKRYDALWEHTCYCAVEPEQRKDYIQAAHDLLKPGGLLLGVFFTAAQRESGPPHMTDRDNLHQLFSKRFTLLWERAPEVYYPARENLEWLMCWQRD